MFFIFVSSWRNENILNSESKSHSHFDCRFCRSGTWITLIVLNLSRCWIYLFCEFWVHIRQFAFYIFYVRCSMHFVQCFSHAVDLLLLLFVNSHYNSTIFCRTYNGTIPERSNEFRHVTRTWKSNTKLNFASQIEDVLIALKFSIVCWLSVHIECAEMFDSYSVH